jgi:hypothetical protein
MGPRPGFGISFLLSLLVSFLQFLRLFLHITLAISHHYLIY